MKWIRRLLILLVVAVLGFFLVVLPVGGSFLITNSRFKYPEKGPRNPNDVGLPVEEVEFKTNDGLTLRGWWSAGKPENPVLIFCHGLNRSESNCSNEAQKPINADTVSCCLIFEITEQAIGRIRLLAFSNRRTSRRQAILF